MTRIPLEQALPGMVLAKAVANANGRVLLPAGCEISDKHIKAMKMWGVTDLSINSDATGESGATSVSPAKLEAAALALAEAFRHANMEAAVMDEVYKAAIDYHARNH
jgi:hypothetical protein